MRTEKEIRAMLKKADAVKPGYELEVDGSHYNFWTELGVFEHALRWVLNDQPENRVAHLLGPGEDEEPDLPESVDEGP